jgi:hypothetical protein
MTRSQTYAVELSRERNEPIVLFDEAEVSLFMGNLNLFPVVGGPIVKNWEMVRAIEFNMFNLEAAEAEVLSLVTSPSVNYGFALVVATSGCTFLGVFERVGAQAVLERATR